LVNAEWESEDARQSHLKWRTETGFFEKIGVYLVAPPQMHVGKLIWDYHVGEIQRAA